MITELIWKGGGRSDLVVCTPEGKVFIEEIVCSEKEESLLKKAKEYPFEMRVIR